MHIENIFIYSRTLENTSPLEVYSLTDKKSTPIITTVPNFSCWKISRKGACKLRTRRGHMAKS